MKKTPKNKARSLNPPDDLLPEYRFDYSQARPNRFAGRLKDHVIIVLDADVAKVFTTPEAVNHALRALINAMPKEKA